MCSAGPCERSRSSGVSSSSSTRATRRSCPRCARGGSRGGRRSPGSSSGSPAQRARSTCCSRGPSACRSSARGRFVVWMFEPPTHRIEQNRQVGARAWQRGSDAVTSLLWRGASAAPRVVLTGSQATADAVRDVTPARPLYPGLDERFSPGTAARGGSCCTSARTTRATTRRPHSPRRARRGSGSSSSAATRARAEGAELAGRVTDDELVDALSPRRRVPRHESVRGLRLSGARGDGVRHAGRRVATRRRSPSSSATPRCSARPRDVERVRRGASARAAHEAGLADDLAAAGSARAAEFTWERTARAARGRRRGGRASVIVLRARPAQLGRGRGLRGRARARSARAQARTSRCSTPTTRPSRRSRELGAAGGTFDLDSRRR